MKLKMQFLAGTPDKHSMTATPPGAVTTIKMRAMSVPRVGPARITPSSRMGRV